MVLIARGLRAVAVLALVMGVLGRGGVSPAEAQTIVVTTTAEAPGAAGDCTLGEAIRAANLNAPVDLCQAGTSSDVIVLQAGATYPHVSGTDAFVLGMTAHVISSTITIQGNGAVLTHEPHLTSLRFFTVVAPGSLTVLNLTLRGGRTLGVAGQDATGQLDDGNDGGDAYGGAIRTEDATTLVLNGVTFIGNEALGGPAGDGHPTGDTAGGDGGDGVGGAIFLGGTLIIEGAGVTLTGNRALGGSGGLHGDVNLPGGLGGNGVGGGVGVGALGDEPWGPIVATDNLARGGAGGGTLQAGRGGAGLGGALSSGLRHLLLNNAYLYNNRAEGGASPLGGTASGGEAMGGAVFSAYGLYVTHSGVVSNTAQGGQGPAGGVALGGALAVGNFAAISARQALTYTVVLSNTAQGGHATAAGQAAGEAEGGGLAMRFGYFSAEGLAAVGNTARGGNNLTVVLGIPAPSLGGGLYFSSTAASLTNITLAHNVARHGGGAATERFGSHGQLTVTHGTLVTNTATFTGGGLGGGLYLDTPVLLRNSIVAHNSGGNCAGAGGLNPQGDNLQYPGSSCGLATQADPLVGAVGDYGGNTRTAPLRPGSPAVDLAAPFYCPTTDQRGLRRPLGAACDLGAFEYGGWLFLPFIRR